MPCNGGGGADGTFLLKPRKSGEVDKVSESHISVSDDGERISKQDNHFQTSTLHSVVSRLRLSAMK